MYINPNTNIRLLKNVPLDNTYDHTIFFANETAQRDYFIGLQKYNLTNYTYQRVKKGVSRVGINADNLYDCNYIMFQNTVFGSKWFYAFITGVEYVNNECSDISFEIDVMQTWLFDCEPDYCFVEREHSFTDAIGEHIEPENIETGEYVYNGYGKITETLTPMCVIIMISDVEENDGTVYDGVYGGCTLYAYNTNDYEGIREKLDEYLESPESIVSMYMCPVIAVGEPIPDGGVKLSYSKSAVKLSIEAESANPTMDLDGYKPKNNKLYTYPYNFMSVSSGKNARIFRYEYFEYLKPTFEIDVPVTMPLQIALRPTKYKGSGSLTLNAETVILDDYPMCSWATDSFRAWLAQNSLPIASAAASAAVAGGLALTGVALPPLAGASVLANVGSLLNQGYKASIAGDITGGSVNSGNVDVASGKKTFYGGRCSVSQEFARIIDNYFTMFGYAVKRVKVPNRSSRPHWNYVKTLGATVTGSVPADDMRKICSIYDKGITFWKNGNEIGRYDLDNTV